MIRHQYTTSNGHAFRSRINLLLWSSLFFFVLSLWSPHSALGKKKKKLLPIHRAYQLLERWRADEAEDAIRHLIKRKKKKPILYYVLAKIRFYQGRYKEALTLLEKFVPPSRRKGFALYQSVQAAYKVTKNYKSIHSPHFTVSFAPGPDKILAHYAIQALEKAYSRLGKIYGYYPPKRVRIEILDDAMKLAVLSPLTEGDIMRTGTIALCKYNRVMLTSPRSLLRGYRWLDTLVHEYTHLVINRIAAGIPIWLHEGLARFSETLWRSPTPQKLSPYAETLLARAIKKDKLITFKQMHPSMAKLPSQKDAALAYAQVFTLIIYFTKKVKGDRSSIATLLQRIHQGTRISKAFTQLTRVPFKRFLRQWKRHLRKQKLRVYADLLPEKKIIKGQAPSKKKRELQKSNFWFKPSTPEALGRRYLQLGELLRGKGRYKASIMEYLKARRYWKNRKPHLQNKIARAYFALKQHHKAIPHLKESLDFYPNYVTTYINLGQAYFAIKRYNDAIRQFEEAAHINPFHPAIHRYLSFIYRKKGKNKKAKRSFKRLEQIQNQM